MRREYISIVPLKKECDKLPLMHGLLLIFVSAVNDNVIIAIKIFIENQ